MQPGEKGIIREIRGKNMKIKLEELGLRINDVVEIIQSTGHGPAVLKKGDTRIGIGSGMTLRIEVEKI